MKLLHVDFIPINHQIFTWKEKEKCQDRSFVLWFAFYEYFCSIKEVTVDTVENKEVVINMWGLINNNRHGFGNKLWLFDGSIDASSLWGACVWILAIWLIQLYLIVQHCPDMIILHYTPRRIMLNMCKTFVYHHTFTCHVTDFICPVQTKIITQSKL